MRFDLKYVIFVSNSTLCEEHGNSTCYDSSKLGSIMLAAINLKTFNGFLFKLLNIVSFDQIINMNLLSIEKCHSLKKMAKNTFRWM